MEYQGISSIIKKGEVITSRREQYEVIKSLNIGLHNTYLAKNSKNKEVILKQFKNKTEEFQKNQKKIFKYLREIHNKDRKFSHYLEYIYEQFQYKNYLFEVKAKIEGESFEDYLFNKKREFKERLKLARQLTKIIMILHKHGIIHSDLKFEQFIIHNNRLKLIDFDNIIIKNKLYLPAGTPPFRSPEHIKNEKIDESSDVFTLAMMIYNILTYTHPFQKIFEKNEFEKEMLIYKVKTLNELNPNFPFTFSKTIQNALSIDKTKRPTAFQIFEDFDYFNMPFLMFKDRKFFIKYFPLKFNQKVASVILPHYLTKFIYNPHFEIFKLNDKIYIKTFSLPPFTKTEKYFYPKLNGKSFRNAELKNGDTIQIGKIEIKYYEKLI